MNRIDQLSYYSDYALFVFHGTENLPTANTLGATVYETAIVDGIVIKFNGINGITAPLDSYLSFDMNNISVWLTGYAFNSETQQSFDGSVTQLDLSNVEFTNSSPVTEPVPEPATMLLLGSGLAGLAAFRKQMKR